VERWLFDWLCLDCNSFHSRFLVGSIPLITFLLGLVFGSHITKGESDAKENSEQGESSGKESSQES
jgi:hypothetical protein